MNDKSNDLEDAVTMFRKRGGMLRASEAVALGIHPRTLYRMRDDPAKQSQWSAFLRKGRLGAEAGTLTEIVKEIADFLLPPAYESANSNKF